VSDEAEEPTDPSGVAAEPSSAEPADEESLDAWGEATAEDTWISIEVEGEGSSVPVTASAPQPAQEPEPDAVVRQPEEPAAAPAPEAAAKSDPTPAPAPAPASGARWQSIASENPVGSRNRPTGPNPYASVAEAAAGTKASSYKRPSSLRAALDERLSNVPRRPLSPPPFTPHARATAAAAAETGKPEAPAGPALPEQLLALVNQRPEVGLGIAFVGGLLLATIIKRLGRR